MRPDALRGRARGRRAAPTIVCAQVGNVNTGAFDDMAAIADAAHAARAPGCTSTARSASGPRRAPWLRHLVAGIERADSWATDGHKWLNVPYDSGLAFVAHPESHRAAMSVQPPATSIQADPDAARDQLDWTPEFSRRARGFPIYAAIRVARPHRASRSSSTAAAPTPRRFAELLGGEPGVEILNDVVLNQVLVRFVDDDGADDRRTVEAVQEDGDGWLSAATVVAAARRAMRISVSNWRTTDDDVERSVERDPRGGREVADPLRAS